MKTPLLIHKTGLLLLLFSLALTASLYAQSESTTTEKQHHELLKYETTYTIEQENEAASMAQTLTGISMKTPDHVFLAVNSSVPDLSSLKKVVAPDTPQPSELAAVEDFEFGEYGDFFSTEKGKGSSGVSVSGGACPTGAVPDYRF